MLPPSSSATGSTAPRRAIDAQNLRSFGSPEPRMMKSTHPNAVRTRTPPLFHGHGSEKPPNVWISTPAIAGRSRRHLRTAPRERIGTSKKTAPANDAVTPTAMILPSDWIAGVLVKASVPNVSVVVTLVIITA